MEVLNGIDVGGGGVKKVKKKSKLNGGIAPPPKAKKMIVKKKAATTDLVNSSAPTSSTPSPFVNCLEGMTAPELIMVRRLAGNDPMTRKKTLRKLRKWLSVLSEKVPDTPESREMIEPNFVRVWKALFYCMWMADKPLPQEQLAESMSDLQNIFARKTVPFLLFVEWFVRTMAREWSWIDRFRMDKFMMLFRRFLRKTLAVIADRKWHNDLLLGFLKIISVHVFNHHPAPAKSKKHGFPQNVTPATHCPLGLQIHFTDIFMEELAKVGGSSIKFPKTLKILTLFMHELSRSNDDRLLEEIRERIFNHLMRQSDVALDYQDELEGIGGDDEDEEEGDEEELGEEDQYLEDEAEGDEMVTSNGVLDPRAGAVDVILPQLDMDYSKLYEKLVEFGGNKEIKLKNRRILYSIASQFRELTQGKYPLALPTDDEPKAPAIPRKEVNKAARELLKLDEEEEGVGGKRRKTKKERKREAKRKAAAQGQALMNLSQESAGSEDNSAYIRDEDLLEHVSDNYMSYLTDELEEDGEKGEVDLEEETEEDGDEVDAEEEMVEEPEPEERGRKRKWKTVVEVEEEPEVPEQEPEKMEEEEEQVILVKRPKLGGKRRASLGNPVVSTPPPTLKGKMKRLSLVSELITPKMKRIALSSPRTPGSSSKKVSFVLTKNTEHPHADYPVSIARSPAIPFDKNKRPVTAGLLKSPATTPKSTPLRRSAALDFF